MDQVAETVPGLEQIVKTIEDLAESVNKYHEVPHVIEVTLPMLCRYIIPMSDEFIKTVGYDKYV